MGKRGRGNRKRKPTEYLAGANWRDVLAGKAVTKEEADRKPGPRPVVAVRCRDCGEKGEIVKRVGWRDRSQRCMRCGGIMDPVINREV